MSLIHWWPLNGTLEDLGIENTPLVNHGATVLNDGKIGKCYHFDGNNSYLITSNSLNLNNYVLEGGQTISLWIRVDSFSNLSDDYTMILGLIDTNLDYNGIDLEYDGGWYMRVLDEWASVDEYEFSENQWIHLAFVCDETKGKDYLFINGNLVEEKLEEDSFSSVNVIGPFAIGGGYDVYESEVINKFKGDVCDVRIYNHALSKKEVKELSKGLILHYNFEDPYVEGTTNLRPWSSKINSTTISGWDATKNDGSIAYYRDGYGAGYNSGVPEPSIGYHAHWVYLNNELVMKFANKNSEVGQAGRRMGITAGLTLPWSAGDKYTISWEQMTDNLNLRPWGGIYYKTTSSATTSFYDGCPGFGTNSKIGIWERFSYTFTVNSAYDKSATAATLFIYAYGSNNEGTCYVRNVQIEYKDHATPFVTYSREQSYIYDNSGYGNNGTINGNCKIVNSSNMGNYCMLFENGVSDYLSNSTFIWPKDKVTISFWWKSSDTTPKGNYHIPISSGGNGSYYEISIPNTGQIRGGLMINGARYVDNGTSTKLLNGNWHLCTMTYDGTTIKRYVDAIQEKATNITGTLNGATGFVFGHYGNDLTYAIKNGNISDIKIYSTALSAEDIKAEYNRKASIDRNGNLFTGEVNEENSNISITKKNQVQTYSFKEGNDTAKFFGGYTLLDYINMPGPAAGATSQHNTIPVLSISYNEIEAEVLRVGKGTSGAILISGFYSSGGNYGQWYTNFASTLSINVSPSSLGSGTVTPTSLPENTWQTVKMTFTTYPVKLQLATWSDATNYWTAQESCYRYVKCFKDGELVLHLVPAKRNKDNVLGMYDLVNHKFYTNQGTGTFTGGTELGPLSAILVNELIEN